MSSVPYIYYLFLVIVSKSLEL